MIAQRQHLQCQPIGLFHLGLAILLAFLTIYPYVFYHNSRCCSVAAYSSDDLNLKHAFIDKFDIIESSDIHWSRNFKRRDLKINQLHADQSHQGENFEELEAILSPNQRVKKVQFSSLGRKFNLILTRPSQLVTDDITVISLDRNNKPTTIPFDPSTLSVLEGHLENEFNRSRATIAYGEGDKLITAHINTGNEILLVEPTYLHKANLYVSNLQNGRSLDNTSQQLFTANAGGSDKHDQSNEHIKDKLLDDTMIVFSLNDHKQFKHDNNNTNSFHPESLCASVKTSDLGSFSTPQTFMTPTESLNPELEDALKYRPSKRPERRRIKRGIEGMTTKNSERTRCTLHLVVDYLFYTNIGRGVQQTTINYLLALVNRVNSIYLPTMWEIEDESSEGFKNMGFTVQNITIHEDYTLISSPDERHYNMQTDKTWAARDFLDNFSYNSPSRHYCLAHLLTYRQFDSPVLGLAYVASARHGTVGGICSPTQQRDNRLYKHNTGISTTRGITGETLITRQADLVVAHELGHNLGAEHDSSECRPSSSQGGAYLMHPFAVMGFEKNNRFLSNCSRMAIGRVLRRKAPTCFVGVVDHICGNGIVEDDEQCDGGGLGFGHNDRCCDSYCRFTPGSQCSDRHSLCCNDCKILPAGVQCSPAEEYNCKKASECDGSSASCPEPRPSEDNTPCVGRGLCFNEQCQPYCEVRGLHSCLCKTPATACKLCCKTSENGTDCRPVVDDRSAYLPDGVLCYRGVCEKGRCEQPIQDVVQRMWDVIEDINFTTFVKFLRDNIILVVLVVSIPIWCIVSHYINEFDRRVKADVMNAMMRESKQRKSLPSPSPFLPRLFVGDDNNSSTSLDEIKTTNYL